MPEGDTVHRTARALARALGGAVVTGFTTTVPQVRSCGPQRLVGETVAAVEPRGKHLLLWFAPSDLALHTHLGMNGSWHLYRPGQRWRKPPRRARATITVPDHVAVCFSAPTCELLPRGEIARHPQLATLGPDALAPATDLAQARRRLDARADWPIGEALLDQRVLAGVGNVYRSEVLFLHGVDPWAPVAEVAGDTRTGLLATAERLLRANAGSGGAGRVTTGDARDGARLHVYGRSGRPCRRCGTPVRASRLGTQARRVYWCPRCQPAGGARTARDPAGAAAREEEA